MILAELLKLMNIENIRNLDDQELAEDILIEIGDNYYDIKEVFFLENRRTILRIGDKK